MYQVTKTSINKKHELYDYCDHMTALSKCLYNAGLFRVRNIFTGFDKDSRTSLEDEVFDEVKKTELASGHKIRKVISYNNLDRLMRVNNNVDFFAGLPMQSAEAVLRKSVQDFNNWLASLKKYRANPKGYTGRPKMPGYLKGERSTFTITNQDAVYYDGYLKLPLTKTRLCLPNIPEGGVLKEVKIKPYYDNYLILCTFEVKDIAVNKKNKHVASIDFGVNNIAALVTDEGHSFLYKGDVIKSCNQGFNKKRSELVSILTKGHTNTKASSKRLTKLSRKRDSFINDQLHKISKDIIDNCIRLKVGTIILGVNKGMKQNSDIGKVNNQNFVNIPISRLVFMITYKAQKAGIVIIEQEESYTSKADFLSKDYIPVYGIDDSEANFSGSRIKRGLYKSAKGTFVNADLNAAANIMQKAGIKAKIGVKVLQNPIVYNFNILNKSIPVKGIAATL